MDSGTLRSSVRTVVAVAREEQVSVKAASLGYHAFNTLLPLALFVIVGLSATGRLEAAATALSSAGVSSDQLQSLLASTTNAERGRRRAAALAFLIFAWSATRTFRTTNATFKDVYGTWGRESFVQRARDVVVATVTTPLAFALAAGLGVVLSLLVDGVVVMVLVPVVLFVALVLGFLPMYYLFPGADLTVREVLPGAVFAAGLWTVSSVFFRLYATVSESVHLYGVVGGLLLLLTWLYVGGLAILLGVAINAVLADRVNAELDLDLGV